YSEGREECERALPEKNEPTRRTDTAVARDEFAEHLERERKAVSENMCLVTEREYDTDDASRDDEHRHARAPTVVDPRVRRVFKRFRRVTFVARGNRAAPPGQHANHDDEPGDRECRSDEAGE